jgi:hypothetical protein
MCYSEFGDILPAMDADVLPIGTSRSKMEMVETALANMVEGARRAQGR